MFSCHFYIYYYSIAYNVWFKKKKFPKKDHRRKITTKFSHIPYFPQFSYFISTWQKWKRTAKFCINSKFKKLFKNFQLSRVLKLSTRITSMIGIQTLAYIIIWKSYQALNYQVNVTNIKKRYEKYKTSFYIHLNIFKAFF